MQLHSSHTLVMLKILQARLQLYVNRELPDVLAGFTSLMAQTVKRLSTMRETWLQSLGQEDSLEKEMATHSSTLAWKIPWTAELGAGHCPWGCKESGTTERLHFIVSFGF